MLRYFYLFCLLLVCIDWCFCNDISHQNHGVPVNGLKNHQKVKHINKNDKMKVKNTRPVYEVPGGEDHVAEIDVLGFIQQPEYDAIKDDGFEDDGSYYGHINKRRSYYDDYGSMKMPHRNVKKRQDFSNSEFSDPSYGQNVNSIDINLPSINNEAITTEKTSIRKQAKKLAFKLPFFSRKKTTDVGKKKKKAKRLKTCARCTKKSISKTTLKSINPNGSQRNNESHEEQKSVRFMLFGSHHVIPRAPSRSRSQDVSCVNELDRRHHIVMQQGTTGKSLNAPEC